jgi:sec-independent protein translocase protein TatA
MLGLDNPLHIAIVLLVVMLLFGAKRMPDVGRSLGTGIREFRQSLTGEAPDATPAGPPQITDQNPPAPPSDG